MIFGIQCSKLFSIGAGNNERKTDLEAKGTLTSTHWMRIIIRLVRILSLYMVIKLDSSNSSTDETVMPQRNRQKGLFQFVLVNWKHPLPTILTRRQNKLSNVKQFPVKDTHLHAYQDRSNSVLSWHTSSNDTVQIGSAHNVLWRDTKWPPFE